MVSHIESHRKREKYFKMGKIPSLTVYRAATKKRNEKFVTTIIVLIFVLLLIRDFFFYSVAHKHTIYNTYIKREELHYAPNILMISNC